MAGEFAYPKRPAHFDRHFMRALTDREAGSTIGPTGLALLAIIVTMEDKRRYTPVDFWTSELTRTLGVSEDALIVARRRCVEAKWLHYEPGTRGRAARYWVEIPGEMNPQIPGQLPANKQLDLPFEPANSGSLAGECPANRQELLTCPNPDPIPAVEAPAADASTKDKPERPRDFLFEAIVEVTGTGESVNSVRGHLNKVHKALKDDGITPEEVREFGRRFFEFCPLARGYRARPTIGELQNQIFQVRASKNGHAPASAFNPPNTTPSKAPPDNRRKVTS